MSGDDDFDFEQFEPACDEPFYVTAFPSSRIGLTEVFGEWIAEGRGMWNGFRRFKTAGTGKV